MNVTRQKQQASTSTKKEGENKMGAFTDNKGEVSVAKIIAAVFLCIFGLIIFFGSWYTISPGERGICVTLGKADTQFKSDGFHMKMPMITDVHKVIIRQQTSQLKAECYSSDLQDLNLDLKILYRIPENQVVKIFRDFAGNPFDSLVAPRVLEALKEVTALNTAESVVKNREKIKILTVEIAKKKVGDLLWVEDIVIENIALTKQLSDAIEQKMIQEQAAAKAKFAQQQIRIEAESAVIKANGDAEAIRVMGNAIAANPKVVELKIVEKWNGVSPTTVVTGQGGANVILPLK